ncbi:MAG: methylenetetrahydrofolate reductase [NAD(P)H] [SAR86 cluster bacterium]|nr:methylenetetrahydrofolate reductase [NAD(P)H] [SAR86 cluster bacterium]
MEYKSNALSFEFFPPKTETGKEKLINTAKVFKKFNPEYFSVTYGAGGSTREGTIGTCKSLITEVKSNACAHISGIGSSKQDIKELLYVYKEIGVTRLVVLRGDLPSGFGGIGDFPFAIDLIKFIKNEMGSYFTLEVAAYPEKHPEALNAEQDFKNFVSKVEAGADGAITQFFYQEKSYYEFMDLCTKKKLDLPIVPGIMPIHDLDSVIRFADGCGANIPKDLLQKLRAYENPEDIIKFGIEIITDLCKKLYSYGVPSIHFYTINRLAPTETIIKSFR